MHGNKACCEDVYQTAATVSILVLVICFASTQRTDGQASGVSARSFASSPSAAAVVSNSQSIINAKDCSEEASSRLVAACAVNRRALERTIAQPLRFRGYELCPIVKFESIRPAALFIAFVSPATDCVFHLNGCCRELFGCLIRIAFHWNSFLGVE